MNWKTVLAYWLACLALGFECLILVRLLFFPGVAGSYSEITRTYWCTSPTVCIHERGHALDDALGWPSRSAAYRIALIEFAGTDHPWAEPTRKELDEGHNLTETYAEMYEAAGGNIDLIPETLRRFYLQ